MSEANKSLEERARLIVRITGIVQGVGFRPFVYRQAVSRGLSGTVSNTSAGVLIDVEGPEAVIEEFLEAVRREAPANAHITGIDTARSIPAGVDTFRIGDSVSSTGDWQMVSPDSCTCEDCLNELFDPGDRRHRYPFINCTNCGPRFTIIESLPYDRHLTTMKKFEMCPRCRAEYEDPADRRFHAEPNACPECGPRLRLLDSGGMEVPSPDPLTATVAALLAGSIVALKGLGGFQLACLATDGSAVARLRERKKRPDKPFALMAGSVADIGRRCRVSPTESRLLESSERPIVLLERLEACDIAPGVAPRLKRLGMMLPCAPLHFLLMDEVGLPLVMTSGNLSDEPICRTNAEALERLGGIADLFLCHDRGIRSTYDDSVLMEFDGKPAMIRRARGFAPLPVPIPGAAADDEPVLAAGALLKNTFCLTRGGQAFVSQHIGDLEDAETLLHYEQTIALFEQLFSGRPARIACDNHPDYLSTSYSLERTPSPLFVQHHRAHIAACLAENNWLEPAVGIALDGTGLGDDGRIWGCEFFTGSLKSGFERAAHLEYMPLPGGEAAVHEPWRMALGAAWRFAPGKIEAVAEMLGITDKQKNILVKQLWAGLNSPLTSSCGRLFDAVAAMVLRLKSVSYEAQAAIELEALAGGAAGTMATPCFAFGIDRETDPWLISPAAVIEGVIESLEKGESAATVAWHFQLALAEAIVLVSRELAGRLGMESVALGGGVFQNRLVLGQVIHGLKQSGLKVLIPRLLPSNDGGLSYGQAIIATFQNRSETEACA